MSTHPRVEELPDDFDESLDLNKPPPKPSANPTSGPELPVPGHPERLKERQEQQKDAAKPDIPPAMAAVESHTTEEMADILNKTPLFMTDISKAGDEREFSEWCDVRDRC